LTSSRTLRIYAHVTQEQTPTVAATFADVVEAAIQGDSAVSVSTGDSKVRRAALSPVDQTGSGQVKQLRTRRDSNPNLLIRRVSTACPGRSVGHCSTPGRGTQAP
jgi:hypothetical protein